MIPATSPLHPPCPLPCLDPLTPYTCPWVFIEATLYKACHPQEQPFSEHPTPWLQLMTDSVSCVWSHFDLGHSCCISLPQPMGSQCRSSSWDYKVLVSNSSQHPSDLSLSQRSYGMVNLIDVYPQRWPALAMLMLSVGGWQTTVCKWLLQNHAISWPFFLLYKWLDSSLSPLCHIKGHRTEWREKKRLIKGPFIHKGERKKAAPAYLLVW
jgi:hypothetical protein